MNAIAAFDPTRAQRRWLLELLHGIEPHNHCQGGHLNFGGTRASLIRRGLMTDRHRLTREGRILAKQLLIEIEAERKAS
jgi:hypothetical protein